MAGTGDPGGVGDEELLLRRIPECWFKHDTGFIDPLAFTPNKSDTTGLSVGRGAFHATQDEAAKGRAGKKYYVAVLVASDVKRSGATVVARPEEGNPGHAEIPDLTYDVRKSDRAEEIIHALRRCVIRVEGPFDGTTVRE